MRKEASKGTSGKYWKYRFLIRICIAVYNAVFLHDYFFAKFSLSNVVIWCKKKITFINFLFFKLRAGFYNAKSKLFYCLFFYR